MEDQIPKSFRINVPEKDIAEFRAQNANEINSKKKQVTMN